MVEWQALSVIGKKAPGGRTLSFGFLFLPESHGPRNFPASPYPPQNFFPVRFLSGPLLPTDS